MEMETCPLPLMFNNLNEARKRREDTDIIFVCQNGEVHAHRFILMSLSDYYRELLSKSDKKPRKLHHRYVKKETMDIIVQFIYCRIVPEINDERVLLEIVNICDEMKLFALIKTILPFFADLLTIDNYFFIWHLADMYSDYGLQEKIALFEANNVMKFLHCHRLGLINEDHLEQFVIVARELISPSLILKVIRTWQEDSQLRAQIARRIIQTYDVNLRFASTDKRGF